MVYVIGCQSGQDYIKVGVLGRAQWSMVLDELFLLQSGADGKLLTKVCKVLSIKKF